MKAPPPLRAARPEDIALMLPRLRAKDAVDLMTATHRSIEATMRASLAIAHSSWVWEVDGLPACMFGWSLRSLVGGGALVWVFTTDAVERHPREFWRGSKMVLRSLLTDHGSVEGWCDARFLQSAQWLRRLGFELGEPLDTAGVPFYHFQMVKP